MLLDTDLRQLQAVLAGLVGGRCAELRGPQAQVAACGGGDGVCPGGLLGVDLAGDGADLFSGSSTPEKVLAKMDQDYAQGTN
ncbi:hypothetical protein ACU639_29440 [Streptomyces cynarae]|uniref:hypothetical protein n=1 Tax=Streptomyces cynarae TaxID=2981134 RepID=UPI00406CE169